MFERSFNFSLFKNNFIPMKKILVIAVLGMMTLSTTSCIKERVCECATVVGNGEPSMSISRLTGTKKAAEKSCASEGYAASGIKVTCTIK